MRHARLPAAIISLILALVLVTPLPAVASALLPPGSAQAAAAQSSANPDASELRAMFGNYGNSGGHWTGGDSTVSVPLPDGRTAWLFSDTFLGTVNSDFSRPKSAPFINNSIVVQQGSALGPTIHGGSSAQPKSLVIASAADEFYWVGDATVADGQLQAVYGKFRKTGEEGPFAFERVGTSLVTFALPGLTVSSVRDLSLTGPVGWGSAIMEDSAYTYVYGSEPAGGLKFGHVARVASGDLGGAWEFWTGSGWSAQESASARFMSGVPEGISVHKSGNQYVLVTQESHEPFSHWLVAYVSNAATGPFTGPIYLESAPEPELSAYRQFIYHGRAHPQLSDPGELLLSYDVNTIENADHYKDVRIYRPRFLEVPWPPPSTGGPAAPTGVQVKVSSEGVATISWTPPPGDSLDYWVYRKNLDNGQTHFARTGYPTQERSLQDGGLSPGVNYAYYVRAVAANGVEGTPSAVVTTRGRSSVPPAPTNLRVTAGTVGDATLTWTAAEEEVAYLVHQRDVTAGETLFTQVPVEEAEATTQKIEGLESGHTYEFKVTAANSVGESLPSNVVTMTARFATPSAPTGLTATAEVDATVTLRWTGSATGDPETYQVYHRPTGTTEFTPLDLPSDTTTMRSTQLISGTTYDFRVAGVNAGGEGPASNVVSATATMRPPGAPTGLTATAGTDGTIKLTWNAVARAGAYWVHRRDVTSGQTDFARSDAPVETTTATVDRLISGNTYEFKVTAVGDGGEGPAGDVARAVADVPPPAAPTGVAATAGDGKVTLTWQAVETAGTYWVYQRDVTAGESTFVKLAYPAFEPRAELGLLTNAHTYEFKVTAENAGGEGKASAVVSAEPMPPLPRQITGLTATPQAGGKVDLTWTAIDGAFYWVHYRDVTAGETELRKLEYPATTAQAQVGPFTGGHVYEFAVAGTNAAGDGPLSDRVRVTVTSSASSATATLSSPAQSSRAARPAARREAAGATAAATSLPKPPTGLQVAGTGDGYVQLEWNATPSFPVYYQIHFKPHDRSAWYVLQDTTPATVTKKMVTAPLWNHFWYDFRVVAVNGVGASSPTNTVTAMPGPGLPKPPSDLVFLGTGNGYVDLAWSPSPTSRVYYWLFFRSAGSSTWYYFQLPTLKTRTRVGYPLWNDQPYDFKVVAANSFGQSSATNVVRGGPKLSPPQSPTALRAEGHQGYVTLNWNPSATRDVYYWLHYRRAGGTSWKRARYPIARTSITFKYVPWGDYDFKVTAVNRAGSADSNVAFATLWTSKRGLMYLMTLNTKASRDMFWAARHNVRYDSYNFNWDTNECTHSPTRPFVPSRGAEWPKQVDFTRACTRHDFGYRNYKHVGWDGYAKRLYLDRLLVADMYLACDNQLPPNYNENCRGMVWIYYGFVRKFAHF
ncbi:phospholipase A2 [Nonomuraea sp. B10E15]|uniref:phospholipase A2 n=1 Tax=Nonomuraea sp. B10E15 TaxID=3153560 RepID=UPI00325D39D1